MTRAARGTAAEAAAARHLEQSGIVVVARNVRCRLGEVDIVARDADVLVFVEVRLRADSRFGGAVASVDAHKQRRLAATARWYLAQQPRYANTPCRFDVVAVDARDASITWIRDAFRVDG